MPPDLLSASPCISLTAAPELAISIQCRTAGRRHACARQHRRERRRRTLLILGLVCMIRPLAMKDGTLHFDLPGDETAAVLLLVMA